MPWFGTVAFWGITWGTIVLTVASIVIGSWQASRARQAARDAFNASLRDRLVSVSTTTAYRSRVYGTVRNVDGILFKASHGQDLRYYTFVVATAGHEIDGFEQAYFNDQALDLEPDGTVTTAPYGGKARTTQSEVLTVVGMRSSVVLAADPVPGSVIAWVPAGSDYHQPAAAAVLGVVGRVVDVQLSNVGGGSSAIAVTLTYQIETPTSNARVRFYKGTRTQDLSADLIALGIPNIQLGVHRFAGIACMLVTLTYSQDSFPAGIPSMSAVMRGALCVDRRTGVAAFTRNPAVIADDWAQHKYGGGLLAAELAAEPLIGSSNACDVAHTFAAGTVSTVATPQTMPMYECGIVCRTEADPSDTLSAIVETMAGQWGWASGRLRIKAGYYTAPLLTIDETWFSDQGTREFTQGLARNDLGNIYNVQIADRSAGYTVVPVAPVRAEAYITADGQELPISMSFEGVTDAIHAQHVAGVMLRRARQGFTISLPLNFRGILLELFDTVAVNFERYGIAGKAMEVATWSFSQDGGTQVLLRETAASVFNPDASFLLLDESPNTALPRPWFVPEITGLGVTSGTTELTDKSVVTRTRVTWDRVNDEAVRNSGKIEVAYILLGSVGTPGEGVDDGGTGWLYLDGARILADTRYVSLDGTAGAAVGAGATGGLFLDGARILSDTRYLSLDGVVLTEAPQWAVVEVAGDAIEAILLGLKSDAIYAFTVRARNTLGVRGPWCVQVGALISSELMPSATGPQGEQGIPGLPGATSYFHVAYADSADGSVNFNQTAGAYIGTYVNFAQADSTSYLTYKWVLVKGAQGPQGLTGIAGVGVDGVTSYLHIKYSDDAGNTFTANLGESVGRYLGTRVDLVAADSAVPSAYTWALIRGADGAQGPQGSQGTPGVAGSTSYFHVAYADSADGSVNFNQTSGSYIGTYVDFAIADSASYSAYQWILVKGSQGPQGLQGIPGTGVDGTTQFLHIKYSDDGGLTFTATSGETPGRYLGTYVDLVAADSNSVGAYMWALIRGADGAQGPPGPQGSQGIPGTVGMNGATSYFHIAYAASADGTVGFNQTGGNYVGTYVNFTPADSLVPSVYTWRLFKGADGAAGTNGIPGTNGLSGQTSYLHIKYSDDGGATFTAGGGEVAGAWIGTFVDLTLPDSTNVGDYSWARLLAPTYRQEAAPVNPAQGSSWLVPSTGKQYIYIGTTWYPTVGTGSIDTDQLAPGSATEVALSQLTRYVYTWPTVNGGRLQVCSIFFTNTNSLPAQIEVTMRGTMSLVTAAQTSWPGVNLSCYTDIQGPAGMVYSSDTLEQIWDQGPNVTKEVSVSLVTLISIPSGARFHFATHLLMTYQGSMPTGPTTTLTDFSLRIAAIKR